MSDPKEKPLVHIRNDSGISVSRPSTAPGPFNSFTAKDFADYEKRLSQDSIVKPLGAYMPHRSQEDDPPRPVTMPGYVHDGFASKDFADYEKRLSASSNHQAFEDAAVMKAAALLESGMLKESGITVELNNAVTVPDKRYPRAFRNIRHKILSVYRRISTLIIIGNLIALVHLVATAESPLDINPGTLATATAVNIFGTIAVRQEWIVNALYSTCLSTPLSAPLRVRRLLAKVYENGGFHSGTAYAGTAWFTLLCATVSRLYIHGDLSANPIALVSVAYITLAVLVVILIFCFPYMRMHWHNHFEFSHRFLGWLAIGCLWALIMLVIENKRVATNVAFGSALISEPSFWFLIAITLMIIMPWLLLRKVRFTVENLSDHALRLNYNEKLAPFRGVAIAESPLGQYHSFATFPNPESDLPNGQSIIVSKAGDWTASQVLDKSGERHYWLRGVPKTGVLGMCLIFRKIVIVTTGSGIGPCLAFLNLPEQLRRPCRVIWSSPRPAAIYGQGICDSVKRCDPDALIWDTRAQGRPNMVQLTYNMYRESGAEAVFVISNPKLTKMLVYAMESRGVPAFGPIWDS